MTPILTRSSLVVLLFGLASSISAQQKKRTDLDGAPLPERAICRLGSDRFLHTGFITRTAFSPDGKRFASASANGEVKVWEWPAGKLVREWRVSFSTSINSACDSMCFSGDGKHLVICNGDVHFFDLADGKQRSHGRTICLPTFSPKNGDVAWIENMTTVCVLDQAAAKEIRRVTRKGDMRALAYDRSGDLLAAETSGTAVSIVNLTNGKNVFQADVAKGIILWLRFSDDAQRLVFGTQADDVHVFDVAAEKACCPISRIPADARLQALSGDGKSLPLSVPAPSDIHRAGILWNLEEAKAIARLLSRIDTGSRRRAIG